MSIGNLLNFGAGSGYESFCAEMRIRQEKALAGRLLANRMILRRFGYLL